ncbi:MAG TPA: metallophosphoesterase [Burkholderiales bacterium]|nr:metallophosphoesterase [Burkholderiales bacterium]HYA46312.1 metallophosphoesterase [Burkholderiales bacterium]
MAARKPSKESSTTTGQHTFGRARLNQKKLAFTGPPSKSGSAFQPLPKPTGKPPFHLDLRDILPANQYAAITKAQHLAFHVAGDLGGINFAVPQERVAQGLEEDFLASPPNPSVNPAFLFVLGDCVYFNGEVAQYYAQYYQPYEHYLAPIFAVPGNHDGDPLAPEKSLDGFIRNFCATKPGLKTPESQDSPRTAMVQPNVYWTLLTPLVSIIGLYSNVPEHGVLHPDQLAWFVGELKSVPASLPILVALHHPPYSADDHHGGSQPMHDALDGAFAKAGRWPDMVLAGHVHDYQRFTRKVSANGRQIPYLVAGAGGYHNLHTVAKVNGVKPVPPVGLPLSGDTITLESYVDDRHGFLRLDVSSSAISGKYYTVPRPQESWSQPPKLADTFQLDTRTHKLV